ncbi:hypothetical protein AB0H63_01425 [Micromonospora echinospora]|uniref:hypothetical protein n=1 Tax=Micromonospora echinospora TaxID=1877 RepID=UPI0033D25194
MEVWLTGTPAELDAATTALTAVAYVAMQGERHPLVGVDAGRYRAYLRLALTATAHPAPDRPAQGRVQGAALIDLDTARAARRTTTRKEKPGA